MRAWRVVLVASEVCTQGTAHSGVVAHGCVLRKTLYTYNAMYVFSMTALLRSGRRLWRPLGGERASGAGRHGGRPLPESAIQRCHISVRGRGTGTFCLETLPMQRYRHAVT